MKEPDTQSESTMMEDKPSFVPACLWVGHWLTVSEFARLMGRSPQTVYKWTRLGTTAEFGISTYEYRSGRKHSARVFVRNPYA